MIDLYCAPTPNGWKISIMLEELALPYTVKPVNIRTGEQFNPEFLALFATPLTARSPCDEAIQNRSAETLWIASLRSQ